MLHLNDKQIQKLKTIHRELDVVQMHKFPEEQKVTKKFSLSEFNLHFRMTFRNYDGTWLPIYWELEGMS